jgi:hypothetical protein
MKKIYIIICLVSFGWSLQAQESKTAEKKSFLSLQPGIGFPLGNFTSRDLSNEDAGFAVAGFTIDLAYQYAFSENIGLAVQGFYNRNDVAIRKLRDLTGLPELRLDHWQFLGLVAGPVFCFPISDQVKTDFKVMGGFASANSPDITTNGTLLVPEDWSGAGVFQTGLALRVDLGNQAFFTGGLDYRYLSPTFKVDSGILSEETTQKMSILKLGVGIGINF